MGAPGTTKGQWAVSKQKARRVTAGGVVICNAVLRNRGGPKHKTEMKDEHEAEANAAQIAASGAMYDALEACAKVLAHHGIAPAVFRQTEAALALARGEKVL